MFGRKLAFITPLLVVAACGGGNKPASDAPPAPPPVNEEKPAAEPETGEKAGGEAEKPAGSEEKTAPAEKSGPIEVKIEARSGSKLSGTAKLEKVADGVKVTIDLTDAPPGKHGAHIHEKADCSAPDAKSAGDHFNPDGHKHGMPPTEQRHLGDLGNLEIDKKGAGHLEITIKGANLDAGDKHSFVDRGIIIHEKIDNGGQPVGNAGGRIGCGEIKR